MHAHEQNIKCRGCGKVFLKGAALLSHIENCHCPGINKSDFETQRAMVASTMHTSSNAGRREHDMLSFATSTVADSVGGGVRLDELSLLDDTEPPENLSEPPPRFGSPSNQLSTLTPKESIARNTLYEGNYPKLGTEPKGKGKGSTASTTGQKENESMAESWVQHNFPNARPTPAPRGWTPVPSESGFQNTIDPANGQPGHFRVMDLKRDPLTGNYRCPFDKCP